MTDLKFDGRPNDTPIGYFTYDVQGDHWSWSDGMYELHGYEPQQTPATTEMLIQHKHPDDVMRAIEVLEAVTRDGHPFSCYHRVVDADQEVRYVLSVGRGIIGGSGKVEQVTGFFVDLTAATHPHPAADDPAPPLLRLVVPEALTFGG